MKRKTIRKHSDFFCPRDCIIAHSWLFMVKTKPVKIPGDARYGLVVQKKEFKFATQRNRAKRLLRDWIAHNEDYMLPELDYVFILNHSVLESTRNKGRYEVRWALKQISEKFEKDEK